MSFSGINVEPLEDDDMMSTEHLDRFRECRNLLPELESAAESTAGRGSDADGETKGDDVLAAEGGEMEHIKVYLRIRPATNEERTQGVDDACISVESDHAVLLCAPPMSQAVRTTSRQRFTFTRVFPPETSQKQFFDGTVHSVVSEFVNGQNCLVFTYGVTNSGKTYTIQGDQQQANAGILPRSLEIIFNRISGRQCTGTLLKPVMFGDVTRLTADQVHRTFYTCFAALDSWTHLLSRPMIVSRSSVLLLNFIFAI